MSCCDDDACNEPAHDCSYRDGLEKQLEWLLSRVIIDRWGIGLPCGNTKVDIKEQRKALKAALVDKL
jgi:hypothetical protein